MWQWIIVAAIAVGACGSGDRTRDDASVTASDQRVVNSPLRAEALALVPGQATKGWHLQVFSDAAAWAAMVDKGGFSLGELAVDFEHEVVVLAAHETIGGQLNFVGWEVGTDGRGLFRYGPSTTFGPAWIGAGAIALALTVPRSGLRSVTFMNGKRIDVTIPLG